MRVRARASASASDVRFVTRFCGLARAQARDHDDKCDKVAPRGVTSRSHCQVPLVRPSRSKRAGAASEALTVALRRPGGLGASGLIARWEVAGDMRGVFLSWGFARQVGDWWGEGLFGPPRGHGGARTGTVSGSEYRGGTPAGANRR